MKKRIDIYTEVAPYDERIGIWQNAVDASERHIEIGKTMQEQGDEILTGIAEAVQNAEQMTKLIQQAANIIDKGVKLERSAHDKKIKLFEEKPK